MTLAEFLEKHWDDLGGSLSWIVFALCLYLLAHAWRAFWSVMK